MLDVDNFKQVNDHYGHARGDAVLKELASLIQLAIRRSDIFARYGGEEFVLLLPQTDAEGAMAEADRMQHMVREHVFRGVELSLHLTISQGIACYPLSAIQDAPDLLKLADAALYKAKHAGKDAIACAWTQ
jgi:diguanylate cyclase (GGDEF)-like protein